MLNRNLLAACLGLSLSSFTPISYADSDLAITVDAAPALIVVNGTTFYSVSVSNYGADSALNVSLSTTLAAGLSLVSAATTQGTCSGTSTVTCSLGSINAGNLSIQATVTLEVTVNSVATVSNEFTITTTTPDSNNLNNIASGMVEVVSLANSADQSVTYDTMPDWAYQGINTSFPVIVVNNGPAAVSQSDLIFRIPLLTLADFVSATPTQGTCTTALTNCVGLACIAALSLPLRVDCDLGALSSGNNANIEVVATTVGNVGDVLQLTAHVSSDTTADPELNNNQNNVFVELIAIPDVEGGAGPGGCFIATAAYGSDMAKEVKLLRDFRDRHLVNFALGRTFISFYYKYSPPVAQYISAHDELRALVRMLLFVPVAFIRTPVVSCIILFCMGFVSIRWMTRRSKAK